MLDFTKPIRLRDGVANLNPWPKNKVIGETGLPFSDARVTLCRKVYVVSILGYEVEIPEDKLENVFENHEPNRSCEQCPETIYGKAL